MEPSITTITQEKNMRKEIFIIPLITCFAYSAQSAPIQHMGKYHHNIQHRTTTNKQLSTPEPINGEGICRSTISHAITNWGSDITQLKLYTAQSDTNTYIFRIDNTTEQEPWAQPVGHGICQLDTDDTGNTNISNLSISMLNNPADTCAQKHNIGTNQLTPQYNDSHMLIGFTYNNNTICEVKTYPDGSYYTP